MKSKEVKREINIFKVNGKFDLKALLLNIFIPIILGGLVGYFIKGSIGTYEVLKKPIIAPPGIVFPIVWTILYFLMGLAAYRIYLKIKDGKGGNNAYFTYWIQLVFNYFWSFIFFTFKLYGISFIWIVILFILVVITFIKFFKIDKKAGVLLIPYLIWLIYAGILNFYIWILNEM